MSAVGTVYAGTLWWSDHERDLLDLKLAEGENFVDRWLISQATTTYRGNPREISIPLERPDIHWRVAHTERVRGLTRPDCRLRNAIQRNRLLHNIQLEDNDIFIFSDLDEITHRQDWPTIIEQTLAHGFIRLTMRRYYGKIDLKCARGWTMAHAVSGAWQRAHPQKTVDIVRDRMPKTNNGVRVQTRGQHFGWLHAEFDTVKLKMSNHAHPENDRARARKHLQAGNGPHAEVTHVVPVDDSYPTYILEDISRWQKYMANPQASPSS